MRPGRLDVQLYCPPPDQAGRLQVLQVHCRAMPLAPDVDLAAVAQQAEGFSGARWQEHTAMQLSACLHVSPCVRVSVQQQHEHAEHAAVPGEGSAGYVPGAQPGP